MYNRPISPHISIYLPQVSSIFSIWNRISSIYVIIVCIFFLLNFKFIVNLYSLYYFIDCSVSNLIYICFYIICIISFIYHFLQGFLHILWIFNIFLDLDYISKLAIIILLFLSLSLLKIIILFL